MTFLIERRHYRPGLFWNSPKTSEWKGIGRYRARTSADALELARQAIGARDDQDLRISGIQLKSKQ